MASGQGGRSPRDSGAERSGHVRSLRVRVARRIVPRLFPILERLGFHIVVADYYSPIPLREERLAAANYVSDLVGVEISLKNHEFLLSEVLPQYVTEFANQLPRMTPFDLPNPAFSSVDAEVYYGMIRHLHPNRVVEIGSGYSTLVAAHALQMNDLGHQSLDKRQIEVIDPYPSRLVESIEGARILEQPVQSVPTGYFASLEAGDILFVDSSHVLRAGGDVSFELLEILPRLQRGVLVHVHDIFLPLEYPARWQRKGWFWNEQHALHAFLAFNTEFKVLWAGSWLAYHFPELLAKTVPSYGSGIQPGSLWLERIRT